MSEEKFSAVIGLIVPEVIHLITENYPYDEVNAAQEFYRTQVYALLEQEETKLWHFSPLTLFNMFDEEMAIVTAEAYAKGDNSTRHQFSGYFNDMWRENILLKDINPEESLLGFRKLHELMNVQKEGFEKSGKVFAVRHTEDFIKRIDEMIKKLEESQTQTE